MPLYIPSTRPRYGPPFVARRRYNDPLTYVVERYGIGPPYNYAGNGGVYGGFGKHPKDWTTGDFDHLGEVLGEYDARERGRRGIGPGGYGHRGGYGDEGARNGGGGVSPDVRDMLAYQHRRLGGMEDALYGTEAERNREAMRRHLRGVLRDGGGEGNGYGNGGGYGAGHVQQRDLDRVERNQRDLERENEGMRRDNENMRRDLDRLRDRERERGPFW